MVTPASKDYIEVSGGPPVKPREGETSAYWLRFNNVGDHSDEFVARVKSRGDYNVRFEQGDRDDNFLGTIYPGRYQLRSLLVTVGTDPSDLITIELVSQRLNPNVVVDVQGIALERA